MPYTRQQWIDRAVEQPHTYRKVAEDAELVTLLPEPGAVVQEGTAITAARMNYIEKGIEDAHEAAAETADSARKLETARTVQTNLASTSAASFNGTANITPGVTGTLPLANGGTGNTAGLAASATQLATARTVQTNLASTSAASFNGTANITPGVTGTLPIANGGTGSTTAAAARNALGLGNTTGALPVANGGTGATTATAAQTALGLKTGSITEIQRGTVTISTGANAVANTTVIFPVAFTGSPTVITATSGSTTLLYDSTHGTPTTTNVTIYTKNNDTSTHTIYVRWVAFYN